MSWRDVSGWLAKLPAAFNAWLGPLPTTPFKILIGATLSLLTFYLYAFLAITGRDKTMNLVAFGMWLSFVAAWATLAYKQYKAKRETDDRYVAAKSGNGTTPPRQTVAVPIVQEPPAP